MRRRLLGRRAQRKGLDEEGLLDIGRGLRELVQVLLPRILRSADLAQLHALLLEHLVDHRRSLELRVQLHDLLLRVNAHAMEYAISVLKPQDLLAEIVLDRRLVSRRVMPHRLVVLEALRGGKGPVAALVRALVGIILRVETHVNFYPLNKSRHVQPR